MLDRRPTVTGAPADTTVDRGTSATFTASATGDPVPTLQWQVSGNGGVDWTDVGGATASPYTFTARAVDTGKKYRAVFTNAAGSTPSTAATLTVIHPAVVITSWPSATAIRYGQTLASSTLSGGVASVAGSFAFTSPDTVPAAGTADQAVTFTPTDTVNYAPVSGTVSVKVNAAPLFSGYTVTTKSGKTLALSLSKILSRASDPDGGTVTLTQVFGPSAQGGSVSLTGTLNYTPDPSFTGTDSFDIELTTSGGGTLRTTVTVTVTTAAATGQNQTELKLRDGKVDLTFRGIPGRTYVIQRSTNLATWTTLATVTATADGRITFTDPSPPQPSGYYRAQN